MVETRGKVAEGMEHNKDYRKLNTTKYQTDYLKSSKDKPRIP